MRLHRCPETIPGWDWEIFERGVKRVSKMPTYDLLDWTDAAGSGMAKGFADHRKNGDLESLGEIGTALVTLWAVHQELTMRAQAQLDPPHYRV